MIEYYPQMKALHIAAVLVSVSIFIVRGFLVQFDNPLAMRPAVRYLSYFIDTFLLATALVLIVTLPAGAFANGWLATKLALLVIYIALGTFALKRGRTAIVRRSCFAAAVVMFALMFIVARTHDPLGPVRLVLEGIS